jgi:hypothetical protein
MPGVKITPSTVTRGAARPEREHGPSIRDALQGGWYRGSPAPWGSSRPSVDEHHRDGEMQGTR